MKCKLPQKVIKIIQPSQKYIPQFDIAKLTESKLIIPNANHQYNYCPNIHIPTINQLAQQPLSTLYINDAPLENHFTSDNSVDLFANYILNEYKCGEQLKLPEIYQNNNNTPNNHQTIQCTIKLLRRFEDKYNIKYVITDKSLGIAIIDKKLFDELCRKEIQKILIQINYHHDPALIRDKATGFVHKYEKVLHPKGKIPNQSLMDVLDDIHHTTNGYFIWNPIYKAHKVNNNGEHTPKIRPVISSNKSPLKPILRLIADGCNILIHVLQDMYNIVNIVQDSYQVINIIDNYINTKFNPNDIILTFDLVSFYTELKVDFLNDKLDYLYNLFKNEYDTKSQYKFYSYLHIISMIKDGYALASKFCIIKIDNKYYVQKQGVIMGASFAPSFANLSILIHIIQTKIYKCKAIKLNLRMVDDTMLILDASYNIDIDIIFEKFYPQTLQFTSEHMNDDCIQFLDILFFKIDNTLQYIMQIKKLKIEFFVPYSSNHPKHMKINIVRNMVNRAAILCSNRNLFYHTFIALRHRFQRSGYPDYFLLRHMDINTYDNRQRLLTKLNNNRLNKINSIIQQTKIRYKSIWIPDDEKRYIQIIHDEILASNNNQYNLKNYLNQTYPNKRIVCKLNNSIQKLIRCKDAQYDAL